MARRTGIRWNANQLATLRRAVKNYNARILAAEKRGINPAILPERQSVKKARAEIQTAAELRSYVSRLGRATAKTLVPTKTGTETVYEQRIKKARKRSAPVANASPINKAIKELEGDVTRGRLPTDRDRVIKGMDFSKPNMLEDWVENNTGKSELWRQNYLKRLLEIEQELTINNEWEEIEQLQALYNQVQEMSLVGFLGGQLLNPAELEINFLYPARGAGYGPRIERAAQAWTDITRML